MSRRIYLVMYDIADDKKRNKTALLLQRYGYERLQYSVFAGLLPPEALGKLKADLEKLVNPETDKLLCVAVGKTHFQNRRVMGNFTADADYLTGERHTLFFE